MEDANGGLQGRDDETEIAENVATTLELTSEGVLRNADQLRPFASTESDGVPVEKARTGKITFHLADTAAGLARQMEIIATLNVAKQCGTYKISVADSGSGIDPANACADYASHKTLRPGDDMNDSATELAIIA